MMSSHQRNSVGSLTDGGKPSDDDDLDIFLTTVESKLRGPFSSLDLARAVQTSALKGDLSPTQYLQNLSKVLARADKVIQSRILIGLLGLEASFSKDAMKNSDENDGETDTVSIEIYEILRKAQTSPTHEEWVRMVAGLIQGIMFQTERKDDKQASHSDAEFSRDCRGEEASQQLSKLCEEVCAAVQQAEAANCPDMNPSYVPFSYTLVPKKVVDVLVPECTDTTKNPHFQVNAKASILQIDQQLETQRAKEEEEHQGPVLMKTKMSGTTISGDDSKATAAQKATALPPGFRPTKLVKSSNAKGSAGATKGGSSMFMPKKTNPLLAKRALHQKTMLRRKGAAQSLVNKTKMASRGNVSGRADAGGGISGTTATPSSLVSSKSSAAAQRSSEAAARFRAKAASSNARSKMKMIDVDEATALDQHHANRDNVPGSNTPGAKSAVTLGSSASRLSKKRRFMEAAASAKKSKVEQKVTTQASVKAQTQRQGLHAAPTTTTATATATADVLNGTPLTQEAQAPTGQEQQQQQQQTQPQPHHQSPDEWKHLLQGRSNKLSGEDHERVRQFFENRYNPTPEVPLVKMKLHEQRSNVDGQDIKETFYLELDYSNFSSKQSRKVKRY